eukprot:5340769-Prorocentrum_lima.AAC.1
MGIGHPETRRQTVLTGEQLVEAAVADGDKRVAEIVAQEHEATEWEPHGRECSEARVAERGLHAA